MKYRELRSEQPAEPSEAIQRRAETARQVQMQRGYANAQMPSKHIREHCKLDEAGERTLEMAVQRMGSVGEGT